MKYSLLQMFLIPTFQYLLVRLKEAGRVLWDSKREISIPLGTIKRTGGHTVNYIQDVFQYLLVRLKVSGGTGGERTAAFQYLLVRLKATTNDSVLSMMEFQYLLVRLKGT